MSFDYKSFVDQKWRDKINWDQLPENVQVVIGEYGISMFGLGQQRVADIEGIKYDGDL